MIGPRSPLRVKLARYKARNEICDGIVLNNVSGFDVVVVKRYGNIARVANDVNNPAVVGLEALMTFQNARTRQPAQNAIGIEINLWETRFDVREGYRFVLIYQIANQEPRPSIARPRIRDQENIVREHGKISSRHLAAGEYAPHLRDSL